MVVPVTGGPGYRSIRDFRFVFPEISVTLIHIISGGSVARKIDISGMHKKLLSSRYFAVDSHPKLSELSRSKGWTGVSLWEV